MTKKLDLERTTDYERIGINISKENQIKKQKTENQCQNASSGNKKSLARNGNLILTETSPTVNYELGKPFTKKSDPKN